MPERDVSIEELAQMLEPWLDSISGSFPRDQKWTPRRRKGRFGL